MRTVRPETAAALRRLVAGGMVELPCGDLAGVWTPIEQVEAPTGRAACRACGEKIAKGGPAIRFKLDAQEADGGTWGRAVTAYVHASPCQEV